MKILLDLIKTHICKIYCKDGGEGTGFFCQIPKGFCNFLPVLVTNSHILNKQALQSGKTINFTINDDEKDYKILIDNNRKVYINEKYDVTIIEIKEDDKIDGKSFFNLDNGIFQEDFYKTFKKCQIYLLHYPKGAKMEISPGVIININEEQTMYHSCDTSSGSSGGPIINKTNFQVIGIHCGAPEDRANRFNIGKLLKEPIEEFKEEINKNKTAFYQMREGLENEKEKNLIKEKTSNKNIKFIKEIGMEIKSENNNKGIKKSTKISIIEKIGDISLLFIN